MSHGITSCPKNLQISDLTTVEMDPPPPPSSTPSSAAATTTTSTFKIRLMCSYGGHIIPRPNSKSLFYAGGDTRIVTIPSTAANMTLSFLTTHLATVLHVTNPFVLKYQLPSHDLDALISLSTNEDLLIMLDEHHRLSPIPARIRLFLFPIKLAELGGSELRHPMTDSWFMDVLKSAKIMQKGGPEFGGEGHCDGNNGVSGGGGGGEVSGGLCGAESMVLETSSSFGSTSSSVSLSNLPAKVHLEDNGVILQDTKISSDNSVPTSVSHLQTVSYQDTVGPVAGVENRISSNLLESESKISDPGTGVESHRTVQLSGFPLPLQVDQPQPQHLQYVQTGTSHYIPQNPPGIMPAPSYYLMNPQIPQQQLVFQTNQPRPVYLVPLGQPYNLPVQSGFFNTTTVASTRPPIHPNSALCPVQLAYNVTAPSSVPELAPQVYRTVPMATSLVTVPHNENHQQVGVLPQMNPQAQSSCVPSVETPKYSNEIDDDPARAQIYKSQPPPPTLPSQYQTMTTTTTVLLSEALSQLHTDNNKNQL